MRKGWTALLLGLLLLCGARGRAEVTVQLSPETARVGEIVEVRVLADEGAENVVYTLSAGGEKIFSGEEDTHFTAAFRPRQEGTYTLQVRVNMKEGEPQEGSAEIRIRGEAETEAGPDTVYSQKDGWWKKKPYSKSTLEKAGCAIFTLSHALLRMGWTGEEIGPAALAVTYRGCYTQGGTANERLLTRASEIYLFTTAAELLEDQKTIAAALKDGDMFSFAIVLGHIALISGVDESGTKVRIVDSAPGATFERIKNGKIYYLAEDGFREAAGPEEIPGSVYYFETATWGGLEYYMDLSYAARRGVRLIRPAWMYHRTEADTVRVIPETVGTALCLVTENGAEREVPTKELLWQTEEGAAQQLAVVTAKSGAKLTNADGKKIASLPFGTILPVLRAEKDRVYAVSGETRGWLSLKSAELALPQETVRTGLVSLKGNTSGRASIKLRQQASPKSRQAGEWKTGTRVAILGEENDFYQVEAKGLRAWIQKEYVTPDETEAPDETAAPEEKAAPDGEAASDETAAPEGEAASDEAAAPDQGPAGKE